MQKLTILFLGVSFLIITVCQKTDQSVVKEKQAKKSIQSVCIWDRISVRKAPSRARGTYLSGLSLGEVVIWDGTVAVDSTDDREYLHIMLSDSSTGWTQSFALVTDAYPAVVLNETIIHDRPDPLTRTSKNFKFLDVVAVMNESADWIEVKGEIGSNISLRRGWIQKSAVSTKSEDITSAVLALKTLRGKSDLSEEEKIKSIVETAPFPESVVIQKLTKQ